MCWLGGVVIRVVGLGRRKGRGGDIGMALFDTL